jgi:hypothetical protein
MAPPHPKNKIHRVRTAGQTIGAFKIFPDLSMCQQALMGRIASKQEEVYLNILRCNGPLF